MRSATIPPWELKTRLAVAPPNLVPGTPHALPVAETTTVCGVRRNNGVRSLDTILSYSHSDSAWDGWMRSVQRSIAAPTKTVTAVLLTSGVGGAMMSPTLGWELAVREASTVT